jgi:hypothetical protein
MKLLSRHFPISRKAAREINAAVFQGAGAVVALAT